MAKRAHWLLPPTPYVSYRAYLDAMGGNALEKARRSTPDALLEAVHRSGLRGRGGAGFPTGVKWRSLAKHPCPVRYVVCNAAEGEPGTFKDRTLLRYNPYAVLEGIAIAAYVIQAKEAFIAIKASFKREIARLHAAIDEMKGTGDRADSGFAITLVEGPEEYLFGEEKAMLAVIEGEGPFPREADDPPYEHGLFATATSPNPVLANNAETLAHVPSIVLEGPESFRAIGTPDTPGTLLFTLSGDLARPGVYELPAGITLRELFHEVGGGPRPGRTLRAAVSGVSSGVVTAEQFDTPADFASLALLGSGLGSAGFMVWDDQASMPRVAQALTRFLYVESCNQCFACKADLRIASRALDTMFDADKATPDLIQAALLGAQHAPQGNRCYLPVEASILLPSFLRRFRGDFEARIAAKDARDEEYVVPKIVDFDETTRTFSYDPMQARKLPTWTYAEPGPPRAPRESQPPRPIASARERPTGPVHVRLSPEVGHEVHEAARERGADLHAHVEEIVREWLKAHHRKNG